MKQTAQDTEYKICKCGRKFKVIRDFRTGIPVSNLCPSCRRIKMNKKILSESTLMSYNKRSDPKPGKYTMKGKKSLKTRKKTSKELARDRADLWFSRYVRVKHGYSFLISKYGTISCKCYTCGNIHSAKTIQCGHWQRRGYKATRYDENNARPQCVKCNMYRSGEPEQFEINLIEEIGEVNVMNLKKLAQSDFHDSTEFYREIADKYRKLTNELLKEKNAQKWW